MKAIRSPLWLLLGILCACHEPNAPLPVAHPSPDSPPVAGTDGSGTPGAQVEIHNRTEAPNALAGTQEARASSFCNIESVGGQAFAGQPIHLPDDALVTGWLGHVDAEPVRQPKLILVDGTGQPVSDVPLLLNVQRDDVVAANTNRTELRDSGFRATLRAAQIPAGEYRLLLTYRAGTNAYRCDNGRRVVK